jgi:signal peptidase I
MPPDSPKPAGSRWKHWLRLALIGRDPRRTLVRAALTAATLLVLFQFIFKPARVVGASMEPTCHDGSIAFINLALYHLREPRRGDIVAIETTGPKTLILKRIIGLPGETLAITNGIVSINGHPLDEPYVKFRDPWQRAPVELDIVTYYVIGDNRGMSQKAHYHGQVSRRKILGKTLW